ncbi:hypothetical protein SANTM175S_09540 [Streptomyces antimycoticus]
MLGARRFGARLSSTPPEPPSPAPTATGAVVAASAAAAVSGQPASRRVSSTRIRPSVEARWMSGPATASSRPATVVSGTSWISPSAGRTRSRWNAASWCTGSNGARASDSGSPPRARARWWSAARSAARRSGDGAASRAVRLAA